MVEPSNKQTTTATTTIEETTTELSTWQLVAEVWVGDGGVADASIMLRADYKSFAVEFLFLQCERCMCVGVCATSVCVLVCVLCVRCLPVVLFRLCSCFEVLNINYVRNLILNCPVIASFLYA